MYNSTLKETKLKNSSTPIPHAKLVTKELALAKIVSSKQKNRNRRNKFVICFPSDFRYVGTAGAREPFESCSSSFHQNIHLGCFLHVFIPSEVTMDVIPSSFTCNWDERTNQGFSFYIHKLFWLWCATFLTFNNIVRAETAYRIRSAYNVVKN